MLKFIATQELGRLSRWLRMLGLDVSSYRGRTHGALIVEALREGRIVLTRKHHINEGLEKNTIVITCDGAYEQIRQVIKITGLAVDQSKMFSRCVLCNVELCEANKEAIKDKIPPLVYAHKEIFAQCPTCKKIYWHGSHVNKIRGMVSQIIKSA